MTRGKKFLPKAAPTVTRANNRPPNIDPHSGEGKAWFRAAVMQPDFLENNFLSNDRRYPLTKIETNSARAFGTNAKAGHVWDNFSSQTYKELSPVDELEFYNPFDETQPIKFKPKEKDAGPATIACRRWSVSGVRRRSCTTTRSESSLAILGRRAHQGIQRCGRKAALAGKATRQGFDLAHAKRMLRCTCARNLCRNRSGAWPTATDTSASVRFRKARRSICSANLEPDLGQLVVLQVKIEQGAGENSRDESLTGSTPPPSWQKPFPNYSRPTNVPTSSKTKDIISARTCRMQTSAR